MIYFHSFKNPGLVLDIVQDIRELNEKSRKSRKAGMIVLGGGVCKHQIANAMLIVTIIYVSSVAALFTMLDLAQRGGLFCIHRKSHMSRRSIFAIDDLIPEHWPRIRWIRLRRKT